MKPPAAPPAGTPAISHMALQQAAEWFAALHAAAGGTGDREQWLRWLEAAPEHRAAWERIEAVNRQFGMLPAEPAQAALALPASRRTAAKKLLLLAGTVALGTAVSRREGRDYLAALAAEQSTAVGETRGMTLADGSRLWLNTASALDIDYHGALRRIALHRGEILVHSGSEPRQPQRPLVVDGRHGRLTALGTRFTVRQHGDTTRLAVFEGAVRIEPAGSAAVQVVAAGTQRRFAADWIGATEAADVLQTAWTRRRLSADRMRLDDFIATLARYRHGHLGCNPAVAGLRLTGSYPLDDIDRVLAALAASLPVRINRIMPWWVTVEPLG